MNKIKQRSGAYARTPFEKNSAEREAEYVTRFERGNIIGRVSASMIATFAIWLVLEVIGEGCRDFSPSIVNQDRESNCRERVCARAQLPADVSIPRFAFTRRAADTRDATGRHSAVSTTRIHLE